VTAALLAAIGIGSEGAIILLAGFTTMRLLYFIISLGLIDR